MNVTRRCTGRHQSLRSICSRLAATQLLENLYATGLIVREDKVGRAFLNPVLLARFQFFPAETGILDGFVSFRQL